MEAESRSQQLHPMLNPIVLTRIFEVCDLTDLFNYRLVSKDWYLLSLTRFRKEATVQICIPEWNQRNGHDREGAKKFDKKMLQWKNLGEKLSVNDGKPYQSYHIHCVDSVSPPYPTTTTISNSESYYHNLYLRKEEINPQQVAILFKNMTEFWSTYGNTIRRLHLISNVYCVKSFKKALLEDTPNLEELHLEAAMRGPAAESTLDDGGGAGEVVKIQPNLKSLSIGVEEKFPITWRLFLSHFPNIERLKIIDQECSEEYLLGFVKTLEEMSSSKALKWKVTDLTLDDEVYGIPHPIPVLRLLQLPLLTLSKLYIDINAKEFGEQWKGAFRTVMLCHGDTLKELYVSRSIHARDPQNEVDSTPLEQFPFHPRPFPSLTKLEVVGKVVPNFHFLEHFPNLRILRVKHPVPLDDKLLDGTDWTRMANVRLPHLQEFQFDANIEDDGEISEDVMRVLVKMMPNVSHLVASLNDESLAVVCENWKNMRELEIWNEKVTGEGITGIGDFDEEILPNITDLKYLRRLKIVSPEVCLSDKSVRSAFLKLPVLRTLDVELEFDTFRRWMRGGNEALKALIQLIPKKNIKRDNGFFF